MIYDVPIFKPILASERTFILRPFEDVIGDLSEVAEIDGHKTATIGGMRVSIPEDIATRLQSNIGKRVGLLKTDSDFRIKISDGAHA